MDAKTVSIWLTLICTVAGVIAHAVTVDERSKVTQAGLVDVRGYLTAAEMRISSLERDRTIEQRIEALEIRLVRLEERMAHK